MNDLISPKYLMQLVTEVDKACWSEYGSYKNVRLYIDKWYETDFRDWENFSFCSKENGEIDLLRTLHGMQGELLLKIAIDLGVETPDFIPSIPSFRNEIKSDYKTASATFEKAFKQIEEHPDIAVGLANAALESIIKEILKDSRIKTKLKNEKTLYDLTSDLLKEFHLFPESDMPIEIKTIGSSLLSVCQGIEKLRSEKTNVHGKTSDDYVISDPLYTYFIVNSISTVGLYLNSYYKKKSPKPGIISSNISEDDLPF
jgi:hypothetical protein